MSNTLRSAFLLDPAVHFLNHGSFGACPKEVFEVYQSWQRRLERQPVLFLGREIRQHDHWARSELAKYLDTQADNLVFVPNATYGVNVIARSLRLSPGDVILTTNHEYGACDYTWEFICGKTGAIYVRHPIALPAMSHETIVEEFWRGVTPRTKIIYLSHITSPTAMRLPVEDICVRARKTGILTVIDGAHAPGQIALSLETVQADWYIGNLHKWALCPKGSGFLYARPEVQDLTEPLVVSWGYNATPETSSGSKFLDYFVWTGTNDPAAYFSVPSALHFMERNEWDQVRKACHQLVKQGLERICNLVQKDPLYPLDSNFYQTMGIAPLPNTTDISKLKRRLYDEFHVEVPLIDWNGQKFVRISIQAYNSEEDLDALIVGLRTLLPAVS